eukprot:TRINITY_DN10386_c0_g1_i1.p1 TRINITY_DN10386_c0_g1~~TRINITY_DN10386_c0_g1_i1.p1  ORF type:complete len:516 (-),score=113.99 TRINITY_DN10386_c0_g1_i1:146-1693(-)
MLYHNKIVTGLTCWKSQQISFRKKRTQFYKRRYTDKSYDYDLIVIGGGSGGLSAGKAASDVGKKVALFDYVSPSSHNTTWGIGGTCVNVGCIPKKLMHRAAIVGEDIKESGAYGWSHDGNLKHDWSTLVGNVQGHIRSLNFGYRVQLNQKKIKFHNALAKMVDPHTVEFKMGDEKKVMTGESILIAVGGRPSVPDIPGAEYGITSDDIFSLEKEPGKTLVVGASYVALECAGFLTGLGYDTTVMVRSILLRGFDQQMAGLIQFNMETNGTNFKMSAVPTRIEKVGDQLEVFYKSGDKEDSEIYDTVLFATGRSPETKKLNVENIGIDLDKSGKIIVNELDQTSVDSVYAIGDVVSGSIELTPVAIESGKLLVDRLYKGKHDLFSKKTIPTAVFTPLEYGSVGYSEEDALSKYGEENIEVYHAFYKPLEFYLPHKGDNQCYVKLICLKSEDEKVIGLHILGPNSGEITQGFALAIKMGATKRHFDEIVGIHPTVAEELTKLDITKSSGADPKKSGC